MDNEKMDWWKEIVDALLKWAIPLGMAALIGTLFKWRVYLFGGKDQKDQTVEPTPRARETVALLSGLGGAGLALGVFMLLVRSGLMLAGPQGSQGPQGEQGAPGPISKGIEIPLGAVIAFNLKEGCPKEGWKAFDAAGSRVIVGAGPNQNHDESGHKLTFYELNATGGEEKHKLLIDEMPNHSHVILMNNGGPGVDTDPKLAVSSKSIGSSAIVAGPYTESRGMDMPHNIMQPYVALFYCEKT